MRNGIQSSIAPMIANCPLFRGPLACLAAAAFLFAGCVSEPAPARPRVAFTNLAINGQPVHMVLDTGAASTVLYSAAANRVGLNFTPPRDDIVAGPFEVVTGMSEPARVTAGAQTFTTRLPVFTLPPSSRLISSTSGEDGVIGWPEVRDNILVFDSAHRTVRSVAQLPKETSGWLKLKVRTHSTLLLETPMSDGMTGAILVDTGAPQGVQLTPAQWQQARAAHPEAPSTIVNHSTWSIGSFAAQAMWADVVRLGAVVLTDVPMENMPASEAAWLIKAAPGAEVACVIGLDALARMDLVVDAKNGFAYLQPKPLPGLFYPGSEYPAETASWNVAENVRLNCDSLFVRSGIDECSSRHFDAAIADYTQALEINPKNPDAYANRALAKLEKGDIADALADDTHAIELNPDSPGIHADRALLRQIHGDFPDALADYDKVIELNPDDSISARLHRQTLLRRLGRPPEDFSTTVAGWKAGWIKTIGLFVADRLDEKALLAAAEKKDAVPALSQQCEAFYYIGMKRLLNGDKTGARDFFQKSVATGVREYAEYQFAAAELARLDAAVPQ
jgi:lipoprotein NlpI